MARAAVQPSRGSAGATVVPCLDPEVQHSLRQISGDSTLPASQALGPADIPALRTQVESIRPTDDVLRHGGELEFWEQLIPGPPGAPDVPILVVRPTSGLGPWPCVLYTSCGGKVVRGNRLGVEDGMLDWFVEFGAIGVFVAPRVGPEDPHPAQVEDCYASLLWLADDSNPLGIDPDRIVILGKSGGGGIAAGTALLARDRGGPRIAHQVLVYPMLDDREATVSSKFEGVPWDRVSNATGWAAMLGDDYGTDRVSAYAAPSRAIDLAGLPPTYLDVGASDIFRDETIAYGTRIVETGVPVELHVWAGATHSSEFTAPGAAVSLAAKAARKSYMQRALRARVAMSSAVRGAAT